MMGLLKLERIKGSRGRRLAFTVSLWVILTAVGTQNVLAVYEWCWRDPVFTFNRQGLLPDRVLDVQVMAQGLGIVSDETATLTVTTPSNVNTNEVLPLSTVFNIATSYDPSLARAPDKDYRIRFTLFFPDTHGPLPVRLRVLNPISLIPSDCDGVAGQNIGAWVQFSPFQLTCDALPIPS